MAGSVTAFHNMAARALDRLRGQFRDPVSVTLIVRNHADPTGERDVVITDDTLDGIEGAIAAARERLRKVDAMRRGVPRV